MAIAVESFHSGGHGSAASAVTVASLTGGTDQLYVVCAALRAYTFSVSSISFGGLTFSQVKSQVAGDNVATNWQFTQYLWVGWGSPSTGDMTVTLSGSAGTAAIAVARLSGFDTTTATEGAASSALADTAAMSLALTSTQDASRLIVFPNPRSTTLTTNPGDATYTRHGTADFGSGGERLVQYCESRALATAGSNTWSGTANAANDHAVIGCVVRPYVAPPPPPDDDFLSLLGVAA